MKRMLRILAFIGLILNYPAIGQETHQCLNLLKQAGSKQYKMIEEAEGVLFNYRFVALANGTEVDSTEITFNTHRYNNKLYSHSKLVQSYSDDATVIMVYPLPKMIYVAPKREDSRKNDPLQALLALLSKVEKPACNHTQSGLHKLSVGNFESNQMLDVVITFNANLIQAITYREMDSNNIWKYEVSKLQQTSTPPFSQRVSELVKKISSQHPTYTVQDLRKK